MKEKNPLTPRSRGVPAIPEMTSIEDARDEARLWSETDSDKLINWRVNAFDELRSLWGPLLTPLINAYIKELPEGEGLEKWFGCKYKDLLQTRSGLPAIEFAYAMLLVNQNFNPKQMRELANKASDRLYSLERQLSHYKQTFVELQHSLDLLEQHGFKKLAGVDEATQLQVRKEQLRNGYRLSIRYLRAVDDDAKVDDILSSFITPQELGETIFVTPQRVLPEKTALCLQAVYKRWLDNRLAEIDIELKSRPKGYRHNTLWIRALAQMLPADSAAWNDLAKDKYPQQRAEILRLREVFKLKHQQYQRMDKPKTK